MAGFAVAEIVENSVTVGLQHLGVNVEARVAELSNLFGEQFDSACGVAENDGLIDLQLPHKYHEHLPVSLLLQYYLPLRTAC